MYNKIKTQAYSLTCAFSAFVMAHMPEALAQGVFDDMADKSNTLLDDFFELFTPIIILGALGVAIIGGLFFKMDKALLIKIVLGAIALGSLKEIVDALLNL